MPLNCTFGGCAYSGFVQMQCLLHELRFSSRAELLHSQCQAAAITQSLTLMVCYTAGGSDWLYIYLAPGSREAP